MKNIHELIGIIKGIDYDEVINEKEVEHLKKWVEKNRNLAYDSKQAKFIQLVEKVLEDNVITEEEQHQLISASQKIVTIDSSSSAAIYELNGIIQGIISDEVLNDAEILQLEAWLNNNAEEILNHEPSRKLYEVIKDILEDGIITEEERSRLLTILRDKINDHEFETKLSYLCKQVKMHNNIGVELIDLLDNTDAMYKIHTRAQFEMMQVLNSYSCSKYNNSEIVFISLCLIAMLEYDGSLFNSIKKVYSELYRRFPEQKVSGAFRELMRKYMTLESCIDNKKRRIINVVLENSIVPKHFLGNFFEFIFDIYRINFECDLSDDLYSDFKFVYDGLKSNMQSEGDTVKDSVTKKTYKLIETTKQLVLNGQDIDSIIKLSIIIVKLIDKRYWGKEVKIYNPYLKQGYEIWNKSFSEKSAEGHSAHSSELRSRWKPKFFLENNMVYLLPPVHKVKNIYNYYDIYIQVINGDEEIYRNECPDVREIIAGYRVSSEKILIENPLGKIEYRLMAGNKVIYKSNESLNRKYIVFSEKGEEINNNTDYKGTAVLCHNSRDFNSNIFRTTNHYMLCTEKVKYGDVLTIDGDVFHFTAMTKPGIFGDVYKNQYLIAKGEKKRIRVYDNVKYLVFENNKSVDKYEITINEGRFKISDFKNKLIERDGNVKYILDLQLDKAGIYIIGVYYYENGKRYSIKKFRIAYDPGFYKSFRKIDAETYSYHIESQLLSRTIEERVKVYDLKEEVTTFNYGGKDYGYCIPFGYDAFMLSSECWQPFSNEIWIGNINQNSEISIYDSSLDKIVVYSDKGIMLDKVQLKSEGVCTKASVGFLLSYKESCDYVVLVLMHDERVKKAIFCNNKCIMRDETEMTYNNETGMLEIVPLFYGEGNVEFTVSNESDEVVFNSGKINNNELVAVDNLVSYAEYKIQFYEKNKGLGLSSKKTRLMKSFDYIFVKKEDLLGKEFFIRKAYHQSNDNDSVFEYDIENTYIKVLSLLDDGRFTGELYCSVRKGYRSNLIKDVVVNYYNSVNNGEIEISITKKERNLMMDDARKRVVESSSKKEIDYYLAGLC